MILDLHFVMAQFYIREIYYKLAIVAAFIFLLPTLCHVLSWFSSQPPKRYFDDLPNEKFEVVQPRKLRTKQLKLILDARGLNHEELVEKKEFEQLVSATGNVTSQELWLAEHPPKEAGDFEFEISFAFQRKVLHTYNALWLVQVIRKVGHEVLFNENAELKAYLHRLGINTATYECITNLNICEKQKWKKSQLVLVLPKKKNHSYAKAGTTQDVLAWIRESLTKAVTTISTKQELTRWLSAGHMTKNRVILFANSKDFPVWSSLKLQIPLFFASLANRFVDDIMFGVVDTSVVALPKSLDSFPVPFYGIVHRDEITVYGREAREALNYDFMQANLEIFLAQKKTQHILPRDDNEAAYEWLLALVNAFVVLDVMLKTTPLLPDLFMQFLYTFFKYNVILDMSWIVCVLGPVTFLNELPKTFLRFMESPIFGDILISNQANVHPFWFLCFTFPVFAYYCTRFLKKNGLVVPNSFDFVDWWRRYIQTKVPPPVPEKDDGEYDNLNDEQLNEMYRYLSIPNLSAQERSQSFMYWAFKLPRYTYHEWYLRIARNRPPVPEQSEDQCVICLSRFLPNQMIVASCNQRHIMHFDCANQYLSEYHAQYNEVRECPQCKQDILRGLD